MSLLLSLGPGATRPCVWPPKVEFLFLQVWWKSCSQACWPSNPDSLGAPLPITRPPGWKPLLGSNRWVLLEDFFGIIIFQFVGHLNNGYGTWFFATIWPNNPTPGHISRDNYNLKSLCTQCSFALLFTMANTGQLNLNIHQQRNGQGRCGTCMQGNITKP